MVQVSPRKCLESLVVSPTRVSQMPSRERRTFKTPSRLGGPAKASNLRQFLSNKESRFTRPKPSELEKERRFSIQASHKHEPYQCAFSQNALFFRDKTADCFIPRPNDLV